jgi:DNA-binding NarL/FixJ family response regulator
MINVVVVDDHAVFREGLRALLARVADITVVGEASNTDEAVAVSADAQPDVVLMDLNLPGGGGEVATRRILATRPETAVLVLTMHADGGHLQQALGAGARGYLLKDAEPAAIVRAITSVHLGQAIFDPGVASHVLAAAAAPDPTVPSRCSPSASSRFSTESRGAWATPPSPTGWASAARPCRTTSPRSCSSSEQPIAPRPSRWPGTRGSAAAV